MACLERRATKKWKMKENKKYPYKRMKGGKKIQWDLK